MAPKRKRDADTENGATAPKQILQEAPPALEDQDFSSCAKTADGKPWNMKITSWNINGIRAWVKKNSHLYFKHEDPDIFCLQETKCDEESLPKEMQLEGYHAFWSSAEKKGYAGTGLFSKVKPIEVTYGLGQEKHDKEGRVITAEFDKFYVVTSYVPNAGRGLVRLEYRSKEWDPDFRDYLRKLDEKKPVILCGDLNVAHLEIDLANPKSNKKNAGFTQEERDGFSKLLDAGFTDSFRSLYPDQTQAYTFWTAMGNCRAKNVGWRLDYFVLSDKLKDNLCDSVIRKDVYGSDHCPVTCLLNI
ncbi:DNA-(apurinic or apyrimidinic site) lyase [Lamellibrachia satsuma]|nr:DNA-(apurinic or apyrimidinic site) lyase [Lamellibrachia satsuma]